MRTDTAVPRRVRLALLVVALAVPAVPFVVPTIWMVAASVKPLAEIFDAPPSLWTDSPTLSAYAEAFTFQPFARQYLNSVYIAVLVTAITLLVSSLAGYAFARIRFPGRMPCSWWC
jgi:ABC-type glycerol-3-phosphate transport system permease component